MPASFARKRAKKEHAKEEDDSDDDDQVKKEEPGETDDDDDDGNGKEDESDVRDLKYKLESLYLQWDVSKYISYHRIRIFQINLAFSLLYLLLTQWQMV